MRRISRWMLDGAALLSLLLCAVMAVAWARSGPSVRRSVEHMSIDAERWRVTLWCASVYDGRMKVFRMAQTYSDGAGFESAVKPPFYQEGWVSHGLDFTFNSEVQPSFWRRAGFSFDRQAMTFLGMDQQVWGMTLPLWFGVCITGLLPVARGMKLAGAWRRRMKTARAARGLCPACSYDLTGNVSRVCPECGAAVSASAAAAVIVRRPE